jgi:hypothetical protein
MLFYAVKTYAVIAGIFVSVIAGLTRNPLTRFIKFFFVKIAV